MINNCLRRLFVSSIAAGLLGIAVPVAQSMPILGNLPTEATASSTQINSGVNKAVGFTPTSDYNLIDVQLFLSGFDTTDGAIVEILQGSSPADGDNSLLGILDVFSQDDPTIPGTVQQIYSWSTNQQLMFVSNTQYWLNLRTDGVDPTSSFSWLTQFPNIAPVESGATFGGYLISNDGGVGYGASVEPSNFQINAELQTPVVIISEASGLTGVGISVALLAMGFLRRRS